jgi:CRISPR-associated protein Csb2
MFAIAVDLLTDRYAATAYNDREAAEWPPHPGRLFSALVAVGADLPSDDPHGQAELEALRWLEQQEPPEILASSPTDTSRRTVAPVFVPVNDVSVVRHPSRDKLDRELQAYDQLAEGPAKVKALKKVQAATEKLLVETRKACAAPTTFAKEALKDVVGMLPDRRVRQPRTFPVAIPACPQFAFVWPHLEAPQAVERALRSLLQRLHRLGHSSSLVHARLATPNQVEAIAAQTGQCVPDDGGSVSIRWVSPGQIARLDRAYASHQEWQPRVLPARFQAYRWGRPSAADPTPESNFDPEFLVFARVTGPRLPPTSVVGLATQFRRALMSSADQPAHSILSGHNDTGGASEQAHLAIVPLPHVSGPFADGSLLGIALMLPRQTDAEARRAVQRAVAMLEQGGAVDRSAEAPAVTILLGSAGELVLRRVAWGQDRRRTLQPDTWSHASRHWATATPIALDRNPGDLHDTDANKRGRAFDEAAESISAACERIGLPRPSNVDVLRSCVLPGTAKPRNYPRFPIAASRPQRVLVHARLTFGEPIGGPVLLGAGRYFGLGLCAPTDSDS